MWGVDLEETLAFCCQEGQSFKLLLWRPYLVHSSVLIQTAASGGFLAQWFWLVLAALRIMRYDREKSQNIKQILKLFLLSDFYKHVYELRLHTEYYFIRMKAKSDVDFVNLGAYQKVKWNFQPKLATVTWILCLSRSWCLVFRRKQQQTFLTRQLEPGPGCCCWRVSEADCQSQKGLIGGGRPDGHAGQSRRFSGKEE